MQLVAEMEFNDCDPLHAFAALREVDLCSAYKSNVTSARPLDENLDAAESLWMILQKGRFSGNREDSIVEVVAVDALDEPINALWVSMVNPQVGEASSLRDTEIPPREKGVHRIEEGSTSFLITPTHQLGQGEMPCGFRLSMVTHAKLPSAATRMPSFALKIMMRKGAQEFADDFRRHVKGCAALDKRIKASPRSSFYQEIKKHLEACS